MRVHSGISKQYKWWLHSFRAVVANFVVCREPEPMSLAARLSRNKLLWGIALLAAIAIFFVVSSPYLSLEYLESQRTSLKLYYEQNPLGVVAAYIALSALLMGAALPVTAMVLLLSGALFGFWVGLLACSVATTIGSAIGFLWSRYLFREVLRKRFNPQFEVINRGIAEEGAYYVFSLRLLMVFPYFLINLICGLTDIRLRSFVIATLASQVIVGALWVYAGTQLSNIDSGSDVLSINVFLTLALIGLAPLLFRRIVDWVRKGKAHLRSS